MSAVIDREEVAKRAWDLYERDIRSAVETVHRGKYLVIDVLTGDYEVDENHLAASDRARAKHPEGILYAMRVGDQTLGRIGIWPASSIK